MRKKLLTFLFAIVASVGTMFAEKVQIGDLYYNLKEDKTAEVTYELEWDENNYKGLTTANIPASVTYSGTTYSVTSIGYEAFGDCRGLTSVIIPNSVTSIGIQAFHSCVGLTSVTIPNSVASIGSGAFMFCSGLAKVNISDIAAWCNIKFSVIGGGGFYGTNPLSYAHHLYVDDVEVTDLVIPNSVTNIGDGVFSGCSDLNSITITNSVTRIGSRAFEGCSGLNSVTIPSSVTNIGDYVFSDCYRLISVTLNSDAIVNKNYSSTSSISGVFGSQVKAYIIGEDVTNIGVCAFYKCSNLTSVTIPNSVASIGWGAFSGCSGLISVVIPNSVTSIGGSAFSSCSSLTSVTIGNSVASLGESAFKGCSVLNSIEIPNSVTSIGESAFSDCSGLISVAIPNSVTSIGNSVFYGCSSLVSVTIPNSVTSVGESAFSGCRGLISIEIPNSVTSIGENAFSGCKGLTSIEIPNSVTSIGDVAFFDCSSLTSVTIPNSVTSIGYDEYGQGAFGKCSVNEIHFTGSIDEWLVKSWRPRSISRSYSLYIGDTKIEECILPNSVTSIGNLAFEGCISLTSISIPNSVTSIGEDAFMGCISLTTILVPCEDVERFRAMLNNDQRVVGSLNIIDYSNLIEFLTDDTKGKIVVDAEPNDCDSIIILSPVPNEGYAFLKWTDGNTDNPRALKLTQEKQTVVAIFHLETITLSYLATGGTDLGEMTTDNSNVWSYNTQYGAYGSKQGGVTGNLFTPATDMSKAKKITLSFQHAHKFAGTPSEELTLWVTKDFKGTWDDSEWQQLTISYTSNTSWTFKSVSIDVPTTYVGTNTVFAFRYKSTQSNYGTWEIKNLKITLEDDGKYEIAGESDQTMGHVEGIGSFDYLSEQILTAIPEYGYHFTQWSDGSTDNPRIIELTSDTTFAAEFAIDKSGVCGDENLLTWDYDQENKRLAISGTGTLNSNYTYGSEAPNNVETLIISNGVTSIGSEAFKGFGTLKSVEIANSVTTIGVSAFENCTSLETLSLGENVSQYGEKAFAGCPNIVSIFNYRPRPSKLGTDVFKDVDYFECTLYVLAGSVDMYKSSGSDWKDFFFIEPIGAESIITEDVKVTPHDNTVDIIWPAVNEANTYEIEITKDGEAFCRLIFNAQGQLTSIAFAPSRANVAQQTQATGFSFTVTGLTSGTKYGYTIAASNSASQIIDTKQGSFTTTGGIATAVDNTNVETKPIKVIRDGQLFILRDGNTYTVQGQQVK